MRWLLVSSLSCHDCCICSLSPLHDQHTVCHGSGVSKSVQCFCVLVCHYEVSGFFGVRRTLQCLDMKSAVGCSVFMCAHTHAVHACMGSVDL